MVTAQDIFSQAMDFANKRSTTGVIDATKTLRYAVRTPGLLTAWQNELSRSGDLYSTFEISHKPFINLLGNSFDVKEHNSIDLIFEGARTCTAYSFDVDGEGTVYIEDFTSGWNILATISVPSTVTNFTNYKGIVTPTSGATKSRIRFSGTYYYNTVNRALFNYALKLAQVPAYAPFIRYEMPDDFKSVSQIIDEYSDQYDYDGIYKWENKKDLYVDYFYEGSIRILYKPIPIVITALTDTIQIDDVSCTSGAYYLAAHLLLSEDSASASFFNDRYMELKEESTKKQPSATEQCKNVYE